jgi:hypothetical protein
LAAAFVAGAACQEPASDAQPEQALPGTAQETAMNESRANAGAPITSAEQAVASFERFWRQELAPRLAGAPSEAWLGSLVESQTPSVTRATRSEYAQRLGGELLHGGAESLQGSGECWVVHYDGLLSTGLGACVDAATGEVLVAQETPEG